MNATYKYGRCSVCGLLLILLGGCSTPLPNPAVRSAANVWVGSTQGTGRWSAKPGNADIEITGVDSERGVFPPYGYLDAGGRLSAPLHLVPASHSIDLAMYAVFSVDMGPTQVSQTVEIKGQGVIDVHHMHVWALSTTENALTAHIVIDPEFILAFDTIKRDLKHRLEHMDIDHCTLEPEFSTVECKQQDC